MIYRFEDFSLDGDRRELRRGSEIVAIEPQVFDVLEFLIVNRERVVSNDDLIRVVWQNRVVSDGTVSTRINAVRHALGDSGALQRLVRTLPRKGYRFAGDIRSESGNGKSSDLAANASREAIFALGDRPSIAVLPFVNFSGDTDQTYFADGMVDEIITALSHVKWLLVIARTSSFTYRDRAIDVRQIGRELGVRYILEGSVRKTENRVRIMAQLIDAQTGTHVWADRFEGALDDVFDLQDRLSARVVGAIAPKLQQAEVERTRHKPTERVGCLRLFPARHGELLSVHQRDHRPGALTFPARDRARSGFRDALWNGRAMLCATQGDPLVGRRGQRHRRRGACCSQGRGNWQ